MRDRPWIPELLSGPPGTGRSVGAPASASPGTAGHALLLGSGVILGQTMK